jgi:23S rRNA (uracil1939-C5)-methyltransferase
LAERELQNLRNTADEIDPSATRVYLTVGDDGALATPATGENSRSAEIDSRGTVQQKIGDLTYRFGVRSFFQGNRLLVEELVAEAIGTYQGRRAVDLYAGVGLFSLHLAGRFDKVCAVEGNRIAAAHGSNNARLNGIYNLQYDPLSVESWLRYRTSGWESPDLLLLDPPRAGAGAQVMERIAELAPTKIAYVSCDPATLARDLRVLVAAGYQIRSVTAVDMFPQTYHIETVVHLDRESLKS